MTEVDRLSTWNSGWFATDGYAPTRGFAVLREGVVGDVIACITVETDLGLAEAFYLRYDPARGAVDLLAKLDLDQPWSVESTVIITPDLAENLEEAIIDRDPDRIFDLLLAAEDGLGISGLATTAASVPPQEELTPPRRHLGASSGVAGAPNL